MIKALADVKVLTSVAGSYFAEAVTACLLERGAYRKHVDRLRLRTREVTARAVDTLADCGWEVFCEPAGGNFLWTRPQGIEDSRELLAIGERYDVKIAPGNFFRPGGETTPWVRVNSAYVSEPRALAFLREAGGKN
jgi:hypothetical protein